LIPPGINADQRGYSRIANGTVDIGSFEYGGVPLVNPPPLVVNTIADGGDYVAGTLTLRQAIAIANAQSTPQTITFDPTVFASGSLHTITLDGQQLEFSDTSAPVTLVGPGQGVLAIDAAHNSRIFLIDGGVTSHISGLALLNGTAAASGGAIDDEGTLTLTDSSISNSTAYGANGGGIFATAGSDPLITNCTISNNTAPGGSGGGIDAQSQMTLANSTISGNSV